MLKTALVGIAMACFCFAGCKQESKPASSGESSGNPLNAPADYVGALGKAQKSAQRTTGLVGLEQAVKNFFAEEGRYPKDLDELKANGATIPAPPAGMKWDYDAKSGTVKVVAQ